MAKLPPGKTPERDAEDYRVCRAMAQRLANEDGMDRGVERHAFGWHRFLLPQRKYRQGHELSCEVVSCENLTRCAPGHGPVKESAE